MAGLFQRQSALVRIGLYVLVGMIVVGLLGTSLAWYLGSGAEQLKSDPSSSQEGAIATEREKQEALREQYKGMLASKPEDLAVLTGYARVEMQLGVLYLQESKSDQGQEAFQRAAELYQKALEQRDDPLLRLELASAYQVLDDGNKAEEELQKILKEEPENILALSQMASLYENKEDWDGAIKVWERILVSPQADEMTKKVAKSRIEELEKQKPEAGSQKSE